MVNMGYPGTAGLGKGTGWGLRRGSVVVGEVLAGEVRPRELHTTSGRAQSKIINDYCLQL